ncbi:MAG: hypothetical protein ACI4N0_05855 [Christensenellales bacterium]
MKQGNKKSGKKRRRLFRKIRTGALILSTLLLVVLAIGSTVAWLSTKGEPITNTFTPSHVDCTVGEEFDGTTKKKVNVTNTGDIDAYIRVKLVTYRMNEKGQHIGGIASLPSFDLGTNWVKYDDYYYYTLPVTAGEQPATNLTDSMTLTGSYNDADGGKQAIDVMAEAIQAQGTDSNGATPTQLAWGVTINSGSVTAYPKTQGGA